MNRKKKIIRNLFLIFICYILTFSRSLYPSPKLAHIVSERRNHYGPSEIVYETDYEKGKYYLGRYGDYYSCDIINRTLGFLWQSSGCYGLTIDPSSPISTYWMMYDYSYWIYLGVITDPDIAYLKFTCSSFEEPIYQSEFHDGMFLFHWKSDTQLVTYHLEAYDAQGNLIYEEDKK